MGSRQMREVGHRLRIPMYVFGPESDMTAVVRLALGHAPVPPDHRLDYAPKQLPKPEPGVLYTTSTYTTHTIPFTTCTHKLFCGVY